MACLLQTEKYKKQANWTNVFLLIQKVTIGYLVNRCQQCNSGTTFNSLQIIKWYLILFLLWWFPSIPSHQPNWAEQNNVYFEQTKRIKLKLQLLKRKRKTNSKIFNYFQTMLKILVLWARWMAWGPSVRQTRPHAATFTPGLGPGIPCYPCLALHARIRPQSPTTLPPGPACQVWALGPALLPPGPVCQDQVLSCSVHLI